MNDCTIITAFVKNVEYNISCKTCYNTITDIDLARLQKTQRKLKWKSDNEDNNYCENCLKHIEKGECPVCDGTGEVHSHNPTCWGCKGTGKWDNHDEHT